MHVENSASSSPPPYQLPARIAKHFVDFPTEANPLGGNKDSFEYYARKVKELLQNNEQPRANIAALDNTHMPKIISMESKRKAGLNLKYYSTPESFIENFTLSNKSQRAIISIPLKDPKHTSSMLRHSVYCDIRRFDNGKTSALLLEPHSFVTLHYRAQIGLSAFKERMRGLTNNRACVIETTAQQSPADCGMHSLSFALKAYKKASRIDTLHAFLPEQSARFPTEVSADDRRNTGGALINFIPIDGKTYLPAEFFKHASSEKTIKCLPEAIATQRVNGEKHNVPESLIDRVCSRDLQRTKKNTKNNTLTNYSISIEKFRAQEIARTFVAGCHMEENSLHTNSVDPLPVMAKQFFSDDPSGDLSHAEQSLTRSLHELPQLSEAEKHILLGVLSLTSGRDPERALTTLIQMQRDFKADFIRVMSTKNANELHEPLLSFHRFLLGVNENQDHGSFPQQTRDVWWTNSELTSMPSGNQIIQKLQGEGRKSSDASITISHEEMQAILQGAKALLRDDIPLSERSFGKRGVLPCLLASNARENLDDYDSETMRAAQILLQRIQGQVPSPSVSVADPVSRGGIIQRGWKFLQKKAL